MAPRVEGVKYATQRRQQLFLPVTFYEGEVCCQFCPAIYRNHSSEVRHCAITAEMLPDWQKMVGEYCPLIEIKEAEYERI